MADAHPLAQGARSRLWLWYVPLGGVAAGVLSALLLAVLRSPIAALAAFAALPLGLVILAAPHLTAYVLVAAMIAQWPSAVLKLGGLAAALSVMAWSVGHPSRFIPRDRLFLLLLPLMALIGLQGVRVGDSAMLNRVLTFLSFVVLYWMLSSLTTSETVFSRIVIAIIASGVLIAALAFVQFVHPFVWIASASRPLEGAPIDPSVSIFAEVQLDQVAGLNRIESLTGTADYLGLSMQIVLPFAFFWTIRQPAGARRWGGVVACLMLAGALVLSVTRGVMVSTAFIVVPMLGAKVGWRRSLPFLLVGLVLVVTPILFWETGRDRVLSTLSEWAATDPSTAGGWRRTLLPIALQMFMDHFWLGAGLGQDDALLPLYAPPALVPALVSVRVPLHNGYLMIAIELGILGLALLIALIGAVWWRTRRLQALFRASGQRFLCDMSHASEVAWVGLAFNVAFYPVMDGSFRYFWVLLATIGALSRLAPGRV